MRWEQLFADVEAQFDAAQLQEQRLEVADRTRRERSLVALADRLIGSSDAPLRLVLAGGAEAAGVLVDAGSEWVLLREEQRTVALVPVAAIQVVRGLRGPSASRAVTTRARRFGLGYALRAFSRDRATVEVALTHGRVLTGTIDGVGADFVELSEHPADAPRRERNVLSSCVVATDALAVVRSR